MRIRSTTSSLMFDTKQASLFYNCAKAVCGGARMLQRKSLIECDTTCRIGFVIALSVLVSLPRWDSYIRIYMSSFEFGGKIVVT
jgi:hypothetical protein